jgi:hypothetical protein
MTGRCTKWGPTSGSISPRPPQRVISQAWPQPPRGVRAPNRLPPPFACRGASRAASAIRGSRCLRSTRGASPNLRGSALTSRTRPSRTWRRASIWTLSTPACRYPPTPANSAPGFGFRSHGMASSSSLAPSMRRGSTSTTPWASFTGGRRSTREIGTSRGWHCGTWREGGSPKAMPSLTGTTCLRP